MARRRNKSLMSSLPILPDSFTLRSTIYASNCSTEIPIEDKERASHIFKWLVLMDVSVECTIGVIAHFLEDIQVFFHMSSYHLGMFASFVFFIIAFVTPIISYVLENYNSKALLFGSLVLHIISLTAFGFLPSSFGPYAPIFVRVGFAVPQTMFMLYGLNWITKYSTRETNVLCMGIWQGASVAAVVTGYALALIFAQLSEKVPFESKKVYELGGLNAWRYPFGVCAVADIAFIAIIYCTPSEILDVTIEKNNNESENEIENGNDTILKKSDSSSEFGVLLDGLKDESKDYWKILTNPLFVPLALCVASLYYVVYGLNTYATKYLNKTWPDYQNMTGYMFLLVCVTGPISGLGAGIGIGTKLETKDKIKKRKWQLIACFILGVFAMSCSLPTYLSDNYGVTIAGVWGVLFFGGAALPMVSTILIKSVKPSLRSKASGLYAISNMVLGSGLSNLLGPLLTETDWGIWVVSTQGGWVACTLLGIICVSLHFSSCGENIEKEISGESFEPVLIEGGESYNDITVGEKTSEDLLIKSKTSTQQSN